MSYCGDCGNWHEGKGSRCSTCKDLNHSKKAPEIEFMPLLVHDRKLLEKKQYYDSISSKISGKLTAESRTARTNFDRGQDVPQIIHRLPRSVLNRMHCPECRKVSIWEDPMNGEYLCCSCGIVINENEILDKYHSRKRIMLSEALNN